MKEELLKSIDGQIFSIDYSRRHISVRDRENTIHPFYWSEQTDKKMRTRKGTELKQWWFIHITGEHRLSDDSWWVTEQQPFQKPADWPGGEQRRQRTGYQPRDDLIVVFQTCYKSNAENVRDMLPLIEDISDIEKAALLYHAAMDLALSRSISDAREIIRARRELG